jgi:hypothetical protein
MSITIHLVDSEVHFKEHGRLDMVVPMRTVESMGERIEQIGGATGSGGFSFKCVEGTSVAEYVLSDTEFVRKIDNAPIHRVIIDGEESMQKLKQFIVSTYKNGFPVCSL